MSKKDIKLFLDDFRNPSDCLSYMHMRIGLKSSLYAGEWVVVKNYQEFKDFLINNEDNITHVSFDHDLADEHYAPDEEWGKIPDWSETRVFKEKTGYDCAKLFKGYIEDKGLEMPEIFIHSMNPYGSDNIRSVFEHK